MMNPSELAALPATQGHIERAKQAVKAYPARQKDLDALLAADPTRGQMVEFMGSVGAEAAADQLNQRIAAICKAVGIDEPTGADRLMAVQIGLLQDQNALLARTKAGKDQKASDTSGIFTGLVSGLMLGAVLTR